MGISTQLIDTLHQYQSDKAVISLYFNVYADNDSKTYQSCLDDLVGKVRHQLGHYPNNDTALVWKDFENTTVDLRNSFKPGNHYTYCVFVSDNYRQTVHLPVRLPNRVVVADRFYMHPLMQALVEFEHFAVLLFDDAHVRLLKFHLGQLEEDHSIFGNYEIPAYTANGKPWDYLQQRKTCYRIEDVFHRHLAFIAETLTQNLNTLDVDKLLLGAPQGLTEIMKRHLPVVLQNKLAATFIAKIDDTLDQLTYKVNKAYLKYRSQMESQMTLTLIEECSCDRAVLGVESVLDALSMGRVRDLILLQDYRVSGYCCPERHALTTVTNSSHVCERCHNVVEPVTDLGDHVIEEALAQDVNLYHLMVQTEPLEAHQMGAFLRF